MRIKRRKVNIIFVVEWTNLSGWKRSLYTTFKIEVEKKPQKNSGLTGNLSLTFAMAGRDTLSIKQIRKTGEQAIVSSQYTRWWKWQKLKWTKIRNESYFELRIKIRTWKWYDLRSRMNGWKRVCFAHSKFIVIAKQLTWQKVVVLCLVGRIFSLKRAWCTGTWQRETF